MTRRHSGSRLWNRQVIPRRPLRCAGRPRRLHLPLLVILLMLLMLLLQVLQVLQVLLLLVLLLLVQRLLRHDGGVHDSLRHLRGRGVVRVRNPPLRHRAFRVVSSPFGPRMLKRSVR